MSLAVDQGQHKTSDESMDAGTMIERLHNLTDRSDAPSKRRKVVDVAEESDHEKSKTVFQGANGGVISDHLKAERAKLKSDGEENTSKQAHLTSIDLTKDDDDDDDDVVMTGVVPVRRDEEVCMGMLHALINAHTIPAAHASAQSREAWPPLKVSLQERPQSARQTAVFVVLDRRNKPFGHLEPRLAHVLAPIVEATVHNKARFKVMLMPRPRKPNEEVGQRVSQTMKSVITVFAPRSRVEAFGRYLSQRNFFLSPPLFDTGCEVVNPHIPTNHAPSKDVAKARTTHNLSTSTVSRTVEEMRRDASDLFDTLNKESELPEMEPDGDVIETCLLAHQKQALYFLKRHEDAENALNQAGSKTSLWRQKMAANGRRSWYHIITGQEVFEAPKPMQGGILADVMGLGKTLSILALIVDQIQEAKRFKARGPVPGDENIECNTRGTLIICPKSVLSNWTDQIKAHVKKDKLKWHTYHGPDRQQDTYQLSKFDIVLTTYNTASAEFGDSTRKRRALASMNWFRIVLDEAHQIRNQTSKVFRACCSLSAQRRWAVTGTPVQNSLQDLGALLRFLRVRPIDEPSVWAQYIMAPFKTADPNVVSHLQLLVSSITLRRAKETIALPDREESIVRVPLSPAEHALYDAFARRSATQLRIMTATTNGRFRGKAYSHVLKSISRLRCIAAHGREMLSDEDMREIEEENVSGPVSIVDLGDEPGQRPDEDFISEQQAYDQLALLQDSETALCMVCSNSLGQKEIEVIEIDSDSEDDMEMGTSEEEDLSEGDDDSDDKGRSDGATKGSRPTRAAPAPTDPDIIGYLTPCLHLVCKRCKPKTERYQPSPTADGYYECPDCHEYRRVALKEMRYSQQKRLAAARLESTRAAQRNAKWDVATYSGPHTKVVALLEDLAQAAKDSSELPEGQPPIRSVVFSGWTTYLDLIAHALTSNGHGFTRLDGTMSVRARTEALTKFAEDPSITVLLVSIKAGGQGLNLTAASRAFVMEPQFNPGVEQQAVDRVYRLGQTRPVVVKHYIATNTIEEPILELQKKKKSLATLSMERRGADAPSKAEEMRERMEQLKALFK